MGTAHRLVSRLGLINSVGAFVLFVAYRSGSHGTGFVFVSVTVFVLLNTIGVIGIWFGGKSEAARPNKFIAPLWIAVGFLWLVYLLDYLFPVK
jgi:hypothetical protein